MLEAAASYPVAGDMQYSYTVSAAEQPRTKRAGE